MSSIKEQPLWLVAAADQRMAGIDDLLGGEPSYLAMMDVVLAPLTEPPPDCSEEEYERWDRTCDCCGTFVPQGKAFYTGSLVRLLRNRKTKVCLTVGVCTNCKG